MNDYPSRNAWAAAGEHDEDYFDVAQRRRQEQRYMWHYAAWDARVCPSYYPKHSHPDVWTEGYNEAEVRCIYDCDDGFTCLHHIDKPHSPYGDNTVPENALSSVFAGERRYNNTKGMLPFFYNGGEGQGVIVVEWA